MREEGRAMNSRHKFCYITSLILLLCLCVGDARADVSFVKEIAPILLKRCTGCHGERANLGGYRAHTYQQLLKIGASGKAAIVPGKPADSRLFQLITTRSESNRMPKSDDSLSNDQIALFRNWISGGAKFDGSDPAASLKNLIGPRQHPASPAVYRASIPVMALAFAPGGKLIVVGGYNELTIWDIATGRLVKRIPHLPQRIQSLVFHKDGKRLLVAGGTPGEYGEVSLIDFSTSSAPKVLDTFNDIVLSAVFSTDGIKIAAGSADGSVRVYSLEKFKRLWTSRVHSDWVTSVVFSSDDKLVASASLDFTVKLNDVSDGALYTTYSGHNRQIGRYKGQTPVYSVVFAANSPSAYSAGGGKWIQIWDPAKVKEDSGDAGDMEERFARRGSTRYIEHGFIHEVFALAIHNGMLFAAAADGILKQFDTTSMLETRSYRAGKDWLFALDYDPVSHRVAAGSYDGTVSIWNTESGQKVIEFAAKPK